MLQRSAYWAELFGQFPCGGCSLAGVGTMGVNDTHTINSTARINQTMVKLIWKKSTYRPVNSAHQDCHLGGPVTHHRLWRIQRSRSGRLPEQVVESIKVFKDGHPS